MSESEVLNKIFLLLSSFVLFGFGFVALILVATSLEFSIASLLPLLIAFLLAHKLYSLVKKILGYRPPIGLTIFEDAKSFVSKRKIVLSVVVAAGFVLWFREFVPPNIVTSLLFLLFNPFAQVVLKLAGFLGKFFAELVTLAIELWFVYLIADAVGAVGKILKRGRKRTVKR